jgi:heat-inducible transcriptional repressor
MATGRSTIRDLNKRSRDIFTTIVDAYVETGEPIGSKTLSQILESTLSPATLRNVMADLEDAGLLYSPHTSAGRLPTNAGLRIFVDGLLELGNLNNEDKSNLEARVAGTGRSFEEVLEEATNTLSGLSNCAGIVLAPKIETPLKHIEFFHLNPGRALVVLVTADGIVENRIIEVPRDIPPSAFIEASNFLNSRFVGQTIKDTCDSLLRELEKNRALLDTLTSKVLEAGLATLGGDKKDGTLIVTGHSKLLEDVNAIADLEQIRKLFSALETTELMLKVLEMTDKGEGVQIFIGADNDLFDLSGCSFIVAPYKSNQNQLVGAIGVIGPTRMNYARIIPMVDYTAKLLSRIIG